MALIDHFGRVHDDLRLSITDRCNLRCTYCMPEDPVWFDRAALLTYEEMTRVARIAVGEGVRKIRVTGGEPLVRRDVTTLIASLAAIPGVEDLSLTTNGVLLRPMAAALASAGLARVNVSLDTLDRRRFEAITGRDRLRDVLTGLEAARGAGLAPIKINAVLLRGRNEDDALPLAAFGRDEGYEVRFIECMPLANGGGWDPTSVVTGASLRAAIGARWPIVRDPEEDPHAPASRFLYEDGAGAVGFIDSVSAPFCGDCSRLRVTSVGRIRVCLYDDRETDLRSALRNGAGDDDVARLLHEALRHKGRGGALDILDAQEALPLARTMHQIGG